MNDYIKERNEAFSDGLISRQAAIDAINEHLEFVTSGLGIDSEVKKIYKMAYNHIIDVISILPDVQPEQKIGRWIETDDYDYDVWRCSKCKEYFYFDEGTPQDNQYYYCPCCGTKMESEVTE